MAKSLGGVCDTRCQQFNNEVAEKENSLRMKWFAKNQQRLLDNLGSHKLVSKAKATMAESQEKRRRQYQEERKIKHVSPALPTWRPPNIDGSVSLDPMKPVNSNVKALLYEDGTESFIAGKNYLYERYKNMPEDRFYFPYCTSWVYGWRLKDYPPVPSSEVGTRSIIEATFFRRNASSLQRDPEWYRICQTGDSKNFNEILTY